jgi:hypothetical protein
MSNTLTNLMPDLYQSLDVVSRELVGFIPAVTLDPAVTRAAVNENVRSFVAPAATASDITPGVTPPNDGDQTIGNVILQITKSRRVPFRWNGEEERGMNNGPGVASIRNAQLQQAIRTLVNEIEADCAALHINASRAVGTAGTTPFATAGDYTAAALSRKVLVDNGSGQDDLQLVIDTASGANIRGKQSQAQIVGTDTIQRQGILLDINGFSIRESAAVKQAVAVGTSTFSSGAAGFAAGSTAITITGTGSLLAGDVITFAGDTNQYVVAAAIAAAGTLQIAAPGLVQALPASAKVITVVAAAARNMAFRRSAIVLAQRLPALPEGGDLARDRTTVVDPRSGLAFEVAMYPQYRQMQYEISCAWGAKVVKTEHLALLLG